jgi:UDP-3-O-[3-hydroxymyristoyl] glucosamine N-acyltransferase
MRSIDISQLLHFSEQGLLHTSGAKSGAIKGISTPEKISKDSLVFISKPEHIEECKKHSPLVVIATQNLSDQLKQQSFSFTLFTVKDLKPAMGLLLPLFDDKQDRFPNQIHPTAVIAKTAKLGNQVRIGAFTVIDDGAIIGDNTIIGPHCLIQKNSKVGSNSILHAFIFLGADCEIGNFCEFHSHTSIGSDGFGFATDRNYVHTKIPQIGKVVFEDHVEVGSNCCFDRATLTETRIKKGTKIDNLCHFAHNCVIGENSLIAAGFFVAGSSQLGARFTTGGNSVVSTHINICDGVTLAGRSTVTNDVTEAGQYGGYPLQKIRDALKTISTIGNLVEMRKTIAKISQHLNLKND